MPDHAQTRFRHPRDVRRSRWTWTAAGLALALLAGLLLLRHHHDLSPTGRAVAGSARGPVEDAAAREPGTARPSGAVAPHDRSAMAARRASLEGVTHLSQLARRAQAAGASADALWDFTMATMLCDGARIALRYKTQAERLGRLGSRQLASLEGTRDFGRRFCDIDTTPLDGLMQQAMLDADPSEDLVLAFGLKAADGEAADPADLPVAERLLLSSSPWAMSRAGDYVLDLELDLPQARAMPRPAFFDDAQARADAQRLALQMVQCRMSGGCGPGGMLTRYYCRGGCSVGRSLAQTWPDNYSPAQIAFAQAVAERMWAERTANGR